MSVVSCVAELTAAEHAARRNFEANRNALQATQPQLTIGDADVGEYLYGRDRTLTARESDQTWHSGCSIPRRAAESMLRNFKPNGPVGILLAPFHAAAVRAVLETMDRNQAVIAIFLNERELSVALRCDDFSKEITGHRVWFAAGINGDEQLAALLRQRTGLPTPSYFIRMPATEQQANEMMPQLQRTVATETKRRDELLAEIRSRGPSSKGIRRVCVVAPGEFRVWGDCGFSLTAALRDGDGTEFVAFDPDDPATSSPLALGQAVSECNAVVTANLGRSNFPKVLSESIPWVTWVTTPRVPAAMAGAQRDGVVLADARWKQTAREAGWAVSQIALGTWPQRANNAAGTGVAVIADTIAIEDNPTGFEYSSHGLLWSAIAAELRENPFAIAEGIEKYLRRRMEKMSIGEDGFDRARFIDALIVPAYQQGIVATLVKNGIEVSLFGAGWDRIEATKKFSRGVVATREQFDAAVDSAAVLIHCWPIDGVHPIDATGRAIVRTMGKLRDGFVRDVKFALRGKATGQLGESLSAATVLRLLRR